MASRSPADSTGWNGELLKTTRVPASRAIRAAASTASELTSMHKPSTRASPMTSRCRCAVKTSTVPFAPGDTTMVLSPAESTVMMAVPVATSSR